MPSANIPMLSSNEIISIIILLAPLDADDSSSDEFVSLETVPVVKVESSLVV